MREIRVCVAHAVFCHYFQMTYSVRQAGRLLGRVAHFQNAVQRVAGDGKPLGLGLG